MQHCRNFQTENDSFFDCTSFLIESGNAGQIAHKLETQSFQMIVFG